VSVYTLVVSKRGVKMKDADPTSRSSCNRASGELGTGAAAVPVLTYTCQNTTMAQLAEAMHNIAPGYVDHVAIDMTNLKGAYDFTLSWSPRQATLGGPAPAASTDSGQSPVAADPSGGITFFDAVEKQLGLHLEKGQKHALPVLVIDHVEEVVAEN
jgi:uncharacterized protein (TIGR03435 family)